MEIRITQWYKTVSVLFFLYYLIYEGLPTRGACCSTNSINAGWHDVNYLPERLIN